MSTRNTIHAATLAIALVCLTDTTNAAEYHIANRDTAGLAAAIRHANASATSDEIHLAEGGLYSFSQAHDDQLVLPPVHGRLTLLGHGAEIRRNTGHALALLEVAHGAELDIDALTLAEGSRGSVRNYGTLRMSRSAIVDGTTHSESAIVQNYGVFEADASTFGWNQVTGAARDAAIVLNYGTMRLDHCRLAGNSISRRYPSLAAAPLLNFGQLAVEGLALEDNSIIDGFDGLASAAILDMGIGHTLGAELPTTGLPLIQP